MIGTTRGTRIRWGVALSTVAMTAMLLGTGVPARAAGGHTVSPATTPTGPFTVDLANREDARQFYYHVHEASNGVPDGWTGSVAGCNPGTVSQDFLDATLTRINYFRAMSGVPSNVVFTPANNTEAQAAALIMSAQGALSHDPPNTWACWTQLGHDGAAASNLALGTPTGPPSIDALMFDGDLLGHRRNMMNPVNTEMGSGSVPTNTGGPAAEAQFFGNSLPVRPPTRDEFVAWPPKGFVPYQVVYPRWSFQLPNADFSAATVTMTHDGTPIANTITSRADWAGPGIVWIPTDTGVVDGSAWPKPGADVAYSVTIDNFSVSGVPHAPITYGVNVIDPSLGDSAHAPSGTANPPVGQNSTYTVPAIPNATGYQWRTTPLAAFPFSDGAENGLGNWTAVVNGYNPIESTTVANGNAAFTLHVSSFGTNCGQDSDTLTLNQTLLPNANSQLSFNSRAVNFGNDVRNIEVSADGGATWSPTSYSQTGGNEGAFSNKVLSLAPYAGEPIKLRFAVSYACDGNGPGQSWFFDDVTLGNVQSAGTPVLSGVGANPSFAFNPPSAGAYAIDVRPQYADAPTLGVFSKTTSVTASVAAAQPLLGLVSSGAKAYAKQGALTGPWVSEGATVSKISVATDAVHGPLVAVITTSGHAYARQGSLTSAWVDLKATGTDIAAGEDATNGAVIGVITNSGHVYAKQGSLTSAWVDQKATGTAISAASDATNGALIGVITTSGHAYAKQGALTGPWVDLKATGTKIAVATDATNGALIGVITNSAHIYAKQGALTSAWVDQKATGTAVAVGSDATNGAVIAVLTNSAHAYAKQGALAGAWVDLKATGTSIAAASSATNGALLAIITTSTHAYAKQGALNGAWVDQKAVGTIIAAGD